MARSVVNILLTHQAPDALPPLLKWWESVCEPEDLMLAYGGTRENFELIDHEQKVYIDDPKLRTKDHQREKQSYRQIFQKSLQKVVTDNYQYVYLCEYDQVPLVADLNARQVARAEQEGADILGHDLQRIDGTNHPHYLYHSSDPRFLDYFATHSVRPNPEVILSMFGTGNFWKQSAFVAMAEAKEPPPIYMELLLPSYAHHRGFRVSSWNEQDKYVSAFPLKDISFDKAVSEGSWTMHPIKDSRVLANHSIQH